MATKTHRFNISITTGDRVYAPGEPVPVGKGAGKVSEDEIAAIEKAHGVFRQRENANAGDTAALEAKLAELSDALSERDKTIKELTASNKELSDALAAAGGNAGQ